MVKNDEKKNSDRKIIKCHFCQEIHSFPENAKGFPVDEYIPKLLNLRHSIKHDSAKRSFNDLTQLIDKLSKLDKEAYVIDYFERVEADILLEKEVNVQKLIAHYQELLDFVAKRKVKCLHNLKTNTTIDNELRMYSQKLMEQQNKFKEEKLNFILKTHDGDQTKWKEIESECVTLLVKTKSLEEEINHRIVADQNITFKPNNSNTPIESICGQFECEWIDSTIISTSMMTIDLTELCQLRGKEFKLIYRASRDGFLVSNLRDK